MRCRPPRCHGGEPDQEQRAQTDGRQEDANYGSQPGINPAQACENVQAREANQNRQQRADRDLHRRNPELRTAGKAPHDGAVRRHAEQDYRQEPHGQCCSPVVLQLVNDSARIFEQRLDHERR